MTKQSDPLTVLHQRLHQAALEAAPSPVWPVSVQFDWIGASSGAGPTDGFQTRAQITRVTRTMVFAHAELLSEGVVTLSASGVFKIASHS